MNRRLSVTDALFGDLPPETRRAYGLPEVAPGDLPETGKAGTVDAIKAATPPEQIPGGPDSPWELSKSSWMEVLKRVFEEISKDRVMSVAAGVTFFGLLALFPAITAFVSIFGLIADASTIGSLTDMMDRLLPGEAAGLLEDQITAILDAPSASLSIATVIGLGFALYSAMGGAKALIEALNVAWFETEKRGFLKLNLVALAFTLGAIVLLIVMIGVIAVVPILLEWLPLGGMTETVVAWVRWPIMFGVLLIALAALYYWGPDKRDAAWHWISPGALLASVGLVVASLLFSWYVANFGNYNKTYGSLGAVIILMTWLWIAAMVVMMGAELNSEAERQVAKEKGLPLKDASAKGSA